MNLGILPFNKIHDDDLPPYGGKAINLSILSKHGFNVPFGVALSKKVFERFLEIYDIDVSYIKKIHSLSMISLDSILKESYDWQEKILITIKLNPIPNEIAEPILKYIDPEKNYAIRSSCISEDSSSSSFAGQYISLLNIHGQKDILRAIKECWTSQYNIRSSNYSLTHRGMPIISPSMGVIIQEMINPNFAGVCFTAGPTLKTSEYSIIEYVDCIGEVLVNGTRTPSHVEINSRGELVKNKLSKENKYNLNENELLGLMSTCKNIEKTFGSPQDIEWAIRENEVFILQSRPISVLGTNFNKEPFKSNKLIFSKSTLDIQNELHDWILLHVDACGYRAANYFIAKQNEKGYWSNPEINEWDVVGTALAINLLYDGGIPSNMIWQDAFDNTDRSFGISQAQNWLIQNVNKDKTWGTDLWDTCQVLIALINSGLSKEHLVVVEGINFVKNQINENLMSSSDKEWYGAAFVAASLKLFKLVETGEICEKCIKLLKLYQGDDGNFFVTSTKKEPVPSEWHTSQVISSLCYFKNDEMIDTMIEKACNWLSSKQHDEGFWGVKEGNYSLFNTFFTSYSIIALIDSKKNYDTTILKAFKWLKNKQYLNGSFGDIWSTLMATAAIQKISGSLFVYPMPLPLYAKVQKALSIKVE